MQLTVGTFKWLLEMAKTEPKPIDITRYTITENGNVIRSKTTNEELKEQDIRLNKLCFDYQEKEKQIADLEWQLQQVIEDNDYYQKENEELQEENIKVKELLKWFVWYFREGSSNLVPYRYKVEEAEQFLNSEVEK